MEDALVHKAGDVEALAQHITTLHEDRRFLERLRAASLRTVQNLTWSAAGLKLFHVYTQIVSAVGATKNAPPAISLDSPRLSV
jgi:hypothetical protein